MTTLSRNPGGYTITSSLIIPQLLDMQAGLGNYLLNPEFEAIRSTDFSIQDVLTIIRREGLLFESGTARQYSNLGYVVLSAVIESVTGKRYEDNLRGRISRSLDSKHGFSTRAEKERQVHRAFGTTIDFEGNKKVSATSPTAHRPAVYIQTYLIF